MTRQAERNLLETGRAHRDWFARTGHCGACGNPGDYCTCTAPCGCGGLHEVGSARDPDSLDRFAAEEPVAVDQGELFG